MTAAIQAVLEGSSRCTGPVLRRWTPFPDRSPFPMPRSARPCVLSGGPLYPYPPAASLILATAAPSLRWAA
jgi:hypothetical protein